MAVTYNSVYPIAGGGLGAFKVGFYTLGGTYATGGFDLGFAFEPVFMAADSGYAAQYDSGKVKLVTSAGEVAAATSVVGVKIMVVTKGD